MAIPFYSQYFVERERNYKYEFLTMGLTMMLPSIHGFLFLWIPWFIRSRRNASTLKYRGYFTFVKYFDSFTRVFRVKVFGKVFFVQPSLLIVMAIHLGVTSVFLIVETSDLDYQPQLYVVAKRVGRISISSILMILLFVSKNTFVSACSGLTLDKSVFFHKWLGRFMFITASIHMALSLKYWLDLKFYIMIKIPPQIFGFIAYSCLGMLNVASFRFIRNFAFDLFLAQHRIFNFVMLLLVYFHNGGNHAIVLLGVHLLVLDRISSRVLGIIHKRKSPTKGVSEFEILDDTTIRVSIPIKIAKSDSHKWWWCFVPRYGNWRAGQHIYLNVFKVSWFQYHPFTIASLADSGKIVLVIKLHKGFTRKLKDKLQKLMQEKDQEAATESSSEQASMRTAHTIGSSETISILVASESASLVTTTEKHIEMELKNYTPSVQEFRDIIDSFEVPDIIKVKAGINGPYGGVFQPLTRFDSVVLMSAGSGASFTLPVALDLLKTIKAREEADDYLYRPANTAINIVLVMKKIANLQWYDHLWEEFLPFLNNGKAHLSVHITQEVPDAADVDGGDCQEKSKNGNEKITQYLMGSSSKHNQSFSTSVSSTTSILGGFSITYARPDFASIIGNAVKLVSSKEYRKSFACLGCGPEKFNGEIKRCCDSNRWVEGAPDVYCYTESFG